MIHLDHLAIPVSDHQRSRSWYVSVLGLTVEFEVPARKTVALRDDADLTLSVYEPADGVVHAACTLTFRVDDVEQTHAQLSARGVAFHKSPQKLLWGYGAELHDPDGYLICLWDERSMREKGG
jgi:catechol 2,3-dioxygenase-like lactoylglutathione lyase family enzyme